MRKVDGTAIVLAVQLCAVVPLPVTGTNGVVDDAPRRAPLMMTWKRPQWQPWANLHTRSGVLSALTISRVWVNVVVPDRCRRNVLSTKVGCSASQLGVDLIVRRISA